MNVSLTPELERLIHDRVKSGRYHSASEVVREALRLLEERDELRRLRRAEMRTQIAAGLASLDRGEGVSGERSSTSSRRASRPAGHQPVADAPIPPVAGGARRPPDYIATTSRKTSRPPRDAC